MYLERPTNLLEVRILLNILRCYRNFISNFAQLTAPFIIMDIFNEFFWNDECQWCLNMLNTSFDFLE